MAKKLNPAKLGQALLEALQASQILESPNVDPIKNSKYFERVARRDLRHDLIELFEAEIAKLKATSKGASAKEVASLNAQIKGLKKAVSIVTTYNVRDRREA
jgi:ribosomal protein S12 methylthiotransferase accessory factor YcaO